MMITFSVLVNIFLFSSIAVAFLSIVLRNNRAILQLDVRFLLICMLGILFRLLIPIESPITRNIAIKRVFPDAYIFLKTPVMNEVGQSVSILTVLRMSWFIGAFIATIKLIYSYQSIGKTVKSFSEVTDLAIIDMVEQINAQRKKKKAFKLMTTDSVYTPFVFGIIKTYIVIPQFEISKEELRFVLKHEMMHYYRGDLIIKILSEILKAVYWWNPFVYLLNRLIAQMQEINVDFDVMRELTDLEKLDYSEILVKIAKIREKHKSENKWVVAFQKESPSAVRKRVNLMLENMEISKRKTLMSLMLSVVIVCQVVLCPNFFIFEPYSIPEEDAEGSVGLHDDDIFYLKNPDCTYSLYFNGQYKMNTKEIFDENIPVYYSLEEVDKNE